MSDKLIPHTANAITLAATNKAGKHEHLTLTQKAATGEVDGVFEDAPKDDKMYARKNGKWVEVPTCPESAGAVTE